MHIHDAARIVGAAIIEQRKLEGKLSIGLDFDLDTYVGMIRVWLQFPSADNTPAGILCRGICESITKFDEIVT